MSTPDTSPGDEMDEILVLFSKKLAMVQGEYNAGLKLSEVQRHAEEAQAEAKDRLNRLMLTRERERLEKLKKNKKYMNHHWSTLNSGGISTVEAIKVSDIDEAIAAIDAQLNKEEK